MCMNAFIKAIPIVICFGIDWIFWFRDESRYRYPAYYMMLVPIIGFTPNVHGWRLPKWEAARTLEASMACCRRREPTCPWAPHAHAHAQRSHPTSAQAPRIRSSNLEADQHRGPSGSSSRERVAEGPPPLTAFLAFILRQR